MQFWSTKFTGCCPLCFQSAPNSPHGRKQDSRLHKPSLPCLFNSRTVFMIHQAVFHVLTNSCHAQLLLPYITTFCSIRCYPRAVQKQNIPHAEVFSFEASRSELFLQQTRMVSPSLSCFSPNVHESARFSFANGSPFPQNWCSSGRGSGYVSWIPDRDVCLCLVRSTLRLTAHLSAPGLRSLTSKNAAKPLTDHSKVTAEK